MFIFLRKTSEGNENPSENGTLNRRFFIKTNTGIAENVKKPFDESFSNLRYCRHFFYFEFHSTILIQFIPYIYIYIHIFCTYLLFAYAVRLLVSPLPNDQSFSNNLFRPVFRRNFRSTTYGTFYFIVATKLSSSPIYRARSLVIIPIARSRTDRVVFRTIRALSTSQSKTAGTMVVVLQWVFRITSDTSREKNEN